MLCFFVIVAKPGVVSQLGLENCALAFTGDIARRDVMVATQVWQRAREVVDVTRALEVDAHSRAAGDGKIVNRGQVQDRRGLALCLGEIGSRKPKILAPDVPFQDTK